MFQNNIVDTLVALIQQYKAMSPKQSQSPEGESIVERVRLIGATAHHVGGSEGMQRLWDDVESKTGEDRAIINILDKMWDRIGSWMS